MVSAHRAAAFYGLNEGVNNHITARIKLEKSDVMLMLPFGIQVNFVYKRYEIIIQYSGLKQKFLTFYKFPLMMKISKKISAIDPPKI